MPADTWSGRYQGGGGWRRPGASRIRDKGSRLPGAKSGKQQAHFNVPADTRSGVWGVGDARGKQGVEGGLESRATAQVSGKCTLMCKQMQGAVGVG